MFEAPSIVFAAAGLAVFAAALLPKLLRNAPLSMPMVFLAAGMLAFSFIPELPDPDPLQYGEFTTHLTEICVIISLMGAGLALDRPVGRRTWSTTWRMLGVAMPICIVALTLLGLWVLGLGLGAALLVAAALAPTDPVLASEVQVGEPADDEDETERGEDEIRFGLTSEAGLNDGLAFPFVYLAIAISLFGPAPSEWFVLVLHRRPLADRHGGAPRLAGRQSAGPAVLLRPAKASGCPPTPRASWRWRRPSWPTA